MINRKFLLFLIFAILNLNAHAGLRTYFDSPPMHLDKHPLLVIHAQEGTEFHGSIFDRNATAKSGIDLIIGKFQKESQPVAYLVRSKRDDVGELVPDTSSWYTEEQNPDYQLFSDSGEHAIQVMADKVTVVGGFAEFCHRQALVDLVSHYRNWDRPLIINYPLSAIYSMGSGKSVSVNLYKKLKRYSAKKRIDTIHQFFEVDREGHFMGRYLSLMQYQFVLVDVSSGLKKTVGSGVNQVIIKITK